MSTQSLQVLSRSPANLQFQDTFTPSTTGYWYAPQLQWAKGQAFATILGTKGPLSNEAQYANDTSSLTFSPILATSTLYVSTSSLNTNTVYWFRAYMWYGTSKTSLSQGSSYAIAQTWTYPAAPSNVNISISGNVITVTWDQDQGGGASDIDARISFQTDLSTLQFFSLANSTTATGNSATLNKTSLGLSDGEYTVYVWARNTINISYGEEGTPSSGSQIIICPIIKLWDWNSANSTSTHSASATAAQTLAAKNAMTNKTAFSNFKAVVWNDMLYKIKEVLDYYNISWKTTYGNFNSTLKSSGNTLTATAMNSFGLNLTWALNGGNDPSQTQSALRWNPVSTGDTVQGQTFIESMSLLNGHIDNYINNPES